MTDLSMDDYIQRLNDPNPDARAYAAWVLGRQRDPRIIAPLIQALEDVHAQVRVRAAESLGNVRDAKTVPPLMAAVKDDDPKVRAQSIASLGRQRDIRAVDVVIQCLADNETPVRIAAATALGELLDTQAVAPLVKALFDDDNNDVRHCAARSLKLLGGTATVEALLAELQADSPVATKIYCAEIFAELDDQRAIAPLQKLAQDTDETVRETARWALQRLGVE